MDGSGLDLGEEHDPLHPDNLSPGSSTGSAVAPTTKAKGGSKEVDPDAPVKKKRKQVKCNKADVGGADCSECLKKSIRCTDSYIRTKPKVVRSGKLIQQAKILYGNGEAKPYIKSESPGNSPNGAYGQPATPPASVVRAAEARFMNTELARSISNHLVEVFHQYVHSQCSVVDWEHFQASWDAAGHVSEAMSPTGECLSLVMQAWAARFSDHAAIIGQGAPAITDIENVPLGSDFTPYGKARDAFARAMQDRAMKMLDHHGALRRPSGQCCAALVLMEFLVTWGDVYRNDGRHLMTAAVEHLRSRNDGDSDDPTEEFGPEMRMSGGTLFWVVYTRDALSSAFGGRATALTTEDLSVLCEILASPITLDVMPYVSSDDPRTLGGLATVAVFRHITSVIRSFCIKISGPLPRRQRLDINSIHDMWMAVDQCQRFSDIWAQSMVNCPIPTAETWMRDLCVMRAQLTHAIHIAIVDRLELERGRPSHDPTYPAYIAHLERLRNQSEERLLNCCRSMARQIRQIGTSLIFVSAMGAENLPLYMAHMISMPVWEQGGVESWTSAAKQEEVGWMIDGVKLLGWSWPNFKLHSDAAEETLRELAHQIEHARRTAAQQQQQSGHQNSASFEMQQELHQQALYPQQQMGGAPTAWYPEPTFHPVPNDQHFANYPPPPMDLQQQFYSDPEPTYPQPQVGFGWDGQPNGEGLGHDGSR